MASDERLVAEVRRGSQRAFEVLYDRHHRGLLAFCRHMLGGREEAEDAVQHTFFAAYRDLVASEKPIALRAWLYTIARNRCLSVLRARRERPAAELEDVPTEGLAGQVQRRADLQDLLRDLAALPEDQRAALVLAELGDLPHDEIAAVVGCRREKVKALVFQARTSLQASRDARELDCSEVRELLSTLRGGALRRTTLRRHVKECAGCQAFGAEVDRQRRAMAVVLPVVPTLGLKEQVLGAVFGAKTAAGAAAAGLGAAGAGGSGAAAAGATTAAGAATAATAAGGGAAVLAAKALVIAAVATGGAVGVTAATGGEGGDPVPAETRGKPSGQGGGPGAAAPVSAGEGEAAKPGRRREGARGHTDRGKRFAEGRGKGRKRGLRGTQPREGRPAHAKTPPAKGLGKPRPERGANKPAKGAKKPATTKPPKPVKSPRPVKPVRTPRPEPTPRPERTPRPKPTPAPTAVPTPVPTPEPVAPADPAAVPATPAARPGKGKTEG